MTGQHLADLSGLDLTDPEVIAALAEQQEITAIRARVHDVLTRTGTTEGKLVALLGITADKARASLAGERRFSTYELAVIATHGQTTVEWLCGVEDGSWGSADDDPAEPNPQAPTPERDGYTIGVYLPPGVSDTVREQLFDIIADATHAAENGQAWDAHVVGVPGDALGTVTS